MCILDDVASFLESGMSFPAPLSFGDIVKTGFGVNVAVGSDQMRREPKYQARLFSTWKLTKMLDLNNKFDEILTGVISGDDFDEGAVCEISPGVQWNQGLSADSKPSWGSSELGLFTM